MKERETDVLHGNVAVRHQVPSTYEEGDKMVGELGGVLDGFVSDCVARNFLPRLYRETAREFVKRFPKENKGTEDKPIYPTDIAYLTKLWEQRDLRKEIEETLQAKASVIPFYQGATTSSGGKVSQAAIDQANKFIAEETEHDAAKMIEASVPNYTVQRDTDGNPTLEGLARGIQTLQKYLQTKAKRELDATLSSISK